jgi:hypothetical protein
MGNSVIFVVISLLVVALIYGSSSTVRVFAEAPAQGWKDSTDCTSKQDKDNPNITIKRCCWYEYPRTVCQTCLESPGHAPTCTEIEKRPTTGQANVPQGGGVLEQPPTPKKHGGTVLPKGGGVIEQPQSNNSPKDNTKLPNDNSGSVEQQQQEQSSAPLSPLKPKGGHNINPAIG